MGDVSSHADHARRFLRRCAELDRLGVRYSVGAVGRPEHAEAIAALRRQLPPHVYLWINADKRRPGDPTPALLRRFAAIDPLFPINVQPRRSGGRPCRTGHSVIVVDGAGTIRRCWFVRAPLGNIYAPGWEAALRPRPCPNGACGCHIGYAHMPELGSDDVFGDGVLERVPAHPLWPAARPVRSAGAKR